MKKNILKKLSAVISGLILIAAVPVALAEVETNTTEIFKDDFESYSETLGNEYTSDFGIERVALKKSGDNRYVGLSLTENDDNTQLDRKFGKTYYSGTISLKYSVQPANGLTTMFYLTNDSEIKEIPRFEDGKIYFDWSGTQGGTYTPGLWYDVEATINLNTSKYDIKIKAQNGGTEITNKTNIPLGLNSVSGIRMQVWSYKNGTTNYDNIYVNYIRKQDVLKEFPYKQNFENIDQYALTMYSGEIGKNGFVTGGDNNSKVFKLTGTSDNDAPELQFNVGELNCGRLTVEADIKTGSRDAASLILLRNGDQLVEQAVLLDGDRGIFNSWSGQKIADKCAENMWYHIKLKIDIDNGTLDTEVTDVDGKVCSYEGYVYAEANRTISDINFQIWSKNESMFVDNVTIEYEKDSLPYTQNFDSVNTNGMTLVASDKSACRIVDCTEGYKKIYSLAYSDEYRTPSLKRNLSGLKDGKLGVEADIKATGKENCQANIFLSITDSEGNKDARNLLGFSCTTGVRIGWNGTVVLPDYDGDKWYHIKLIIDVEEGTVDALVSDGDKQEVCVNGVQIFEPGATLWNVYFQRWGNERGVMYVDNINITDTPLPFEEAKPQKVILKDYFDDYKNIEDLKQNWNIDISSATRTNIADGYFTLGLDEHMDNAQAYRRLPKTLIEGKMRLSFDVKPGGTIDTHIGLKIKGGGASPLIYFDEENKGIYAGVNWKSGTPIAYWSEDEWYECDIVVDMDTQTMNVSCKSKNSPNVNVSNVYVPILECGTAIEKGGYESFLFQNWKEANDTSSLDNLVIMECGMTITDAGVYDNKTLVNTLDELKQLNDAVIRIVCENSMEEDRAACVYIASYNNEKLLKCKTKELDVSQGEYKAIKNISISSDDINDDADCVRFFIWSNSDTMLPLCDKIELKHIDMD